MKILLVGNPNVGKSCLFSRLTGVEVICSNYPGTTVSFSSGKLKHGKEIQDVIDVPGMYSLKAETPAEKVATEMLPSGDVIVDVVDATNLERNLALTLELLECGKPVIISLNMVDDARHRGIEIDAKELEKLLGVPVVETVAVTGQGIRELVERIPEARALRVKRTDEERWKEAGRIISIVQNIHDKKHTLLESLEDATIQPLTGIPIALLTLYLIFMVIVGLGNLITEKILDPFFYGIYAPLVRGVVDSFFPAGIIHTLLVGTGDDLLKSTGALTTGIYVPLGMILPFVFLFYFMLGILEDIGYLPRLATLMDNVMHIMGLHGSAIIPAILGLGCKVPGMLATRILETEKQRFISATLIAISIPCLAQNAVIIGLLSRYGIRYIAMVYAVLIIIQITVGMLMNRFVKGESPEILLEIPPYRKPDLKQTAKKTWTRVRYFLQEAVPYIVLGVVAINILYITGIVGIVASTFGPALSQLFGLPQEAVIAIIVGFLRKDAAVGMLAAIEMTPMQLTIASILLVTYFPCIATFMVMYRELGIKNLMKSIGIMVLATAITGFVLKTIFLT